jgi:deazaflavin-dependent oxidoreductase (nitroreductase family)
MSLDHTPPVRKTATAPGRGPRFSVPRGLLAGTLVAAALVWGPYALIPRSSLLSAQIQTGIYLGLLLLTICSRRAKVLAVRILQRYTLNPLFRLLLTIGVNPFGLAILETRGHLSGKTRRVPVGNGRKGDSFWIIAEHGSRAGWVHNIQHDPRVRVRLRIGLRYRWVPGIATIRPDEDALARQRKVIAWHPLRALNAVNVRVLGADLLAVHVTLQLRATPAGESAPPAGPRLRSREHRSWHRRTASPAGGPIPFPRIGGLHCQRPRELREGEPRCQVSSQRRSGGAGRRPGWP